MTSFVKTIWATDGFGLAPSEGNSQDCALAPSKLPTRPKVGKQSHLRRMADALQAKIGVGPFCRIQKASIS